MIKKGMRRMMATVLTIAVATIAVEVGTGVSDGLSVPAKAGGNVSGYAEAFESLYSDVITNGETKGYLSSKKNSQSAYGVPYHALEKFVVDGSVDYGHETTSEDVSYLATAASIHDILVNRHIISGSEGELEKAWSTMEAMIPGWSKVTGMDDVNYYGLLKMDKLQTDVFPEAESPSDYPTKASGVQVSNPYYRDFKSAYGSDNGYYMMQSMADVDDWYGFGGRGEKDTGDMTYLRTYERGKGESIFETVPHPAIDRFKYGNTKTGMMGIYGYNDEGDFFLQDHQQYRYNYSSEPGAELRAISAVYMADDYRVPVGNVSVPAGKMGDQLRNAMFDKYYYKPGTQSISSGQADSDEGALHYLMGTDTTWGGLTYDFFDSEIACWQTGSSDISIADQNPYAAYALGYSPVLSIELKACDAVDHYRKSLKRQIELYMWLQSKDGPFAPGCTCNYRGRYERYPTYGSTFYDMLYTDEPTGEDDSSDANVNGQAKAVLNLARLYYEVVRNGNIAKGDLGSINLEDVLRTMLEKWIGWFIDNVQWKEDGSGNIISYAIPETLEWGSPAVNHPDPWTGSDYSGRNENLTCDITSYGNSDIESVSSICNALIYYAAANYVDPIVAVNEGEDLPEKALYCANKMLSFQYARGRDDKGISFETSDPRLSRVYSEEVYIPTSYEGTMPDGPVLENGATTFSSIRSQYRNVPEYLEAEAYFNGRDMNGYSVRDNNGDGVIDISDYRYRQHKFAGQCSAIAAYGTMALLFPEVSLLEVPPIPEATPTASPTAAPTAEPTATPTTVPTTDPTATPTTVPGTDPTAAPTKEPGTDPTAVPTKEPGTDPTVAPTTVPGTDPTAAPSKVPDTNPTATPSKVPGTDPTAAPTKVPGTDPTATPKSKDSEIARINGKVIKANVYKNNKKLKKLIIGKNVRRIGKQAFYGCKNLKTIIILSKHFTKKSIGKNAFKGIHKEAVIRVPKKKLKTYRSILIKAGINGAKQKITV